MTKNKTKLDFTADILMVVGALNWGLVGLFSVDVVKSLFGSIPILQKAVYVVVGLAGAYKFFNMFMD